MLAYVEDLAEVDEVVAIREHTTASGFPIRVYVVAAPGIADVLAESGEPCLVDSAGELASAYGMQGGDAVLVRPDGCVGWTARPLGRRALAAHLELLAGRSSTLPDGVAPA